MVKVAYILPIHNGIPPFIYDELCELEKAGVRFALFPTYFRPGLRDPKPSWKVHRITKGGLAFGNLLTAFSRPATYFRCLSHSLRHKALVPFAVAAAQHRKMKDCDRMHAHFGDSKLFIAYYCHRFTRKPYSVTIHAHELWRNNMPLFRAALRRADRVFPISDFNKRVLMDKFRVPEAKITRNYLFVDTEVFAPRPSLPHPKVRLLTVASFHKKKGHDLVFGALLKLNRPGIEYRVVGSFVPGVSEWDVQRVAANIGAGKWVKFLGQKTGRDLVKQYDECDIYVLPSRTIEGDEGEGIPVTLMEAMSCGKPVISTRHKGIPELVSEVLIDENDVDALADAIARLADDPDLRRIQGMRNRQIILERFSKRNVQTLIRYFTGKL